MVEASKNVGTFLWGINLSGEAEGTIIGLFSNSNGTCLQLSEMPLNSRMSLSGIVDNAIRISYNCTLTLQGTHANILVQGLGIFLNICPIQVMQGAGPHILVSGNGAAGNIQTSISFLNPNLASIRPNILDANIQLSEDSQIINDATTFASTVTIIPTSN